MTKICSYRRLTEIHRGHKKISMIPSYFKIETQAQQDQLLVLLGGKGLKLLKGTGIG